MSEDDSEEHEIIVDTQSTFYYVECPFCGTEFAVWEMLRDTEFFPEATTIVTDEDVIKIYCPKCGEHFPLVVGKAPEVFLQPSPFDERLTSPGEEGPPAYNFTFKCLKCDKTYDANAPGCPQCGSTENQEVLVRYEKG